MPTRLTLALALLLALAPLPARAQEKRVPFLAVLEFRVDNKVVPLDTAATLANLARSRVVRQAGGAFKLMSREQVFEILSKANKSAAQCTAECEVQTAREIGADYVLTGSISPLGAKAVLVLDVKKAKDGVTVASASAKAAAMSLDETLDAAVDQLVAELKEKLGTPVAEKSAEASAPKQPFGGTKAEAAKELETDDLEETVVKFTSNPPAVVFLGSRQLCAKTPCQKSVALGKQNVTMSAEDYLAKTEVVDVLKTTDEVKWQLQADFATLNVTCGGDTVALTVDGVAAGNCPLSGAHLRPGKHRVALDSPCYLSVEEAFQVARGEAKALTLAANPRLGVVTIKANDDAGDDLKGKVLLDGKELGAVPGSFKVPVCGKKLEVQADGHASWTGELKVVEGEKVKVGAQLRKGVAQVRVPVGPRSLSQVNAAMASGTGKFRDNGDGTVAQRDAGLVWQKLDSREGLDWAQAASYCAQFGAGWRLPTVDELVRLIDKSGPEGNKIAQGFVNSGSEFWSASLFESGPYAWGVYFFVGSTGYDQKSSKNRARCVK